MNTNRTTPGSPRAGHEPSQESIFVRQDCQDRCYSAFTLVELLAVITVIALLGSTLTATLARTKPNNQAIRCMNNLRQLLASWQMYNDDNNGRIVISLHGGQAQGGVGDAVFGKSWVEGWLDWTTATDNTNVLFLIDERWARLARYTGKSPNLYKCPADKYLTLVQLSRGWTQRARSYSANIDIGDGNAEQGPTDPIYKHVRKISEMLYPSPGQTWVYLDEHPDSMKDPAFFSPHQTAWIDNPATYHNGAAGFAFADGHTEIHKWTGSLTRLKTVSFNFTTIMTALPADPDVHWVSFHSQRVSPNSY